MTKKKEVIKQFNWVMEKLSLKLNKAMKGYFTKKNTETKEIKEFRVSNLENFKEGNEFGLEIFKDIKFVDTKSKTIGKGLLSNEKTQFWRLKSNSWCFNLTQISWIYWSKSNPEGFKKEKKWPVIWEIN